MAEKTFIVTAACVGVTSADGTRLDRIDRGGVLPADADPVHVQLLLDRGMVEEGVLLGGVVSDPDALPPFALPQPHPAKKAAAVPKAD